jgi:hypothetical protein
MCGEIEDEASLEEQIVAHFREVAQLYLKTAADEPSKEAPEASVHGYMDHLFAVVLRKCLQDLDDGIEGHSLEHLRVQAIVLARLSGLLASQLPPELETLPASMDAMLVGYREIEKRAVRAHHHHHH